LKQAYKSKLSRERIILAAINDFNSSTPHDIHINAICRENNISKGLLYHYFSSKDDLFCACTDFAVKMLADDIDSFEVNNHNSLAENLHDYYEARIDYWLLNPQYYTITHQALNSPQLYNVEKLRSSKKIFNDAADRKLLEILHQYDLNYSVSERKLLDILRMVYENMFLTYMDKIMNAVKMDDTERAINKHEQLIFLYDNLIDLLLYGIIKR